MDYLHQRIEYFELLISHNLSDEDCKKALEAFDQMMSRYDLVSRETSLSTFAEANPAQETIRLYAAYKKSKGHADNSIKNGCYIISKFFSTTGLSPYQVRLLDLIGYLANYEVKHNSSITTMNNHRSYFRSYFKFLKKVGIIKENPAENLEDARIESKLPRYLRYEDFMEIVRRAGELDDISAKPLLELMYFTAGRLSDIVQMKIKDIHIDKDGYGSIKVLGKGKKERVLYIRPDILKDLQNYWETRSVKSSYVICQERQLYENPDQMFISTHGLREKFYKIMEQCNTAEFCSEKITPHVIRRTWATHAVIDNKMPVQDASLYLGHDDTNVTQHYIGVNTKQIKESVKKYS